jgi:hypothetical protein
MKAQIATFLALAAACRLAVASDAFPAITTTDGKTYDHITTQRVDPDGLYIEYAPGGKGMGSAKLRFSRLSVDLQKQYGYDADAAKKYEDETYQATLAFRTWADQQEAARQKARAEAEARELQEAILLAQQNPAQATTAPMDSGNYGGGMIYYDGGYSYGVGGAFNHFNHNNNFTGSTFRGTVPFSQLFTPLGYDPTRTQVQSTTPCPPVRNIQRPARGSSSFSSVQRQ